MTSSKSLSKDWFPEYVADIPAFLTFEEGVYGMSGFAATDIPAETQLLRIPYGNIFSEKYAITTDIGATTLKILQESSNKLNSMPRLALYFVLIAEKHSPVPTKFQSYAVSLPVTYDDPLWWAEEDVDLLQNTTLYASIQEKRTYLMSAFQAVHARLDRLPEWYRPFVTLQQVIWAHSAFTSRAFPHNLSHSVDEKLPSEEFVGCMLPVLDILNHQYRTPISWVRYPDGLAFITHKNIEKGCEVFNNYGPKSNGEFLMGYGFTLRDNPHDTYLVSLGAKNTPTESIMEQLKTRTGITAPFACRRKTSAAASIPDDLIAAMHLLRNPSQLASLPEGSTADTIITSMTTTAKDTVMRYLVMLFAPIFVKMADTRQKLLSIASPTYRQLMVKDYVNGQHDIVRDCLQQLFTTIAPLQNPDCKKGTCTPRVTEATASCDCCSAVSGINEQAADAAIAESTATGTHVSESVAGKRKRQDSVPLPAFNPWLAEKDFNKGDVVLSLCHNHVLSLDTLGKRHKEQFDILVDTLGLDTDDTIPDFPGDESRIALSILLIAELQEAVSSPWHAFLSTAFAAFTDDSMRTNVDHARNTELAEEMSELVEAMTETWDGEFDQAVKVISRSSPASFPKRVYTRACYRAARRITDALARVALYGGLTLVILPILPAQSRTHDDTHAAIVRNACWDFCTQEQVVHLVTLAAVKKGQVILSDANDTAAISLLGLSHMFATESGAEVLGTATLRSCISQFEDFQDCIMPSDAALIAVRKPWQ